MKKKPEPPPSLFKTKLSKEQKLVMIDKETEKPFSGKYWDCEKPGTYCCAACKTPLFSSETKYNSGTGWPSFSTPIDLDALLFKEEAGFFTKRTEVCCKHCGCHLGHLFNDGPKPSGKRYCLNSIALFFIPE